MESAEKLAGWQHGRGPSGKPGTDTSARFCREKSENKDRDEKQCAPHDFLSVKLSKMSSVKEHGVTRAVSRPPDGAFLSARKLPAPHSHLGGHWTAEAVLWAPCHWPLSFFHVHSQI